MNWSIERMTPAGIGTALLILVAIAGVAYVNGRGFIETTRSVADGHEILTKLEVTISLLKDTETGMRGYILTGEERFLEPYSNALAVIGQQRNELRELLQGNRHHLQQLDALEFLIQRKLAFTEEAIDLRKARGFQAGQQRVLSGLGQQLMDEIRLIVSDMQREEYEALNGRIRHADTSAARTMAILLFGTLLAMALVTVATVLMKRSASDRKLAQEALHASEEKFRAVAETANEAMVFADRHGKITYCNKAASRTFDYAERELLGKSLTILMPERFHEAHSRGLSRFLSTGEARVVGKTVELTGRRRDGREFPLELSLARWERAGELVFIGIIRDISERKRAAEDRDRFFSLSLDMFCFAGFDGYFKYLNPAWEKTLGYTLDELLAKPYRDFIHPDDRAATAAEASKISAGATTIAFENRYRCKDGSYRWFLWNASPSIESQLIYATARDITERKQQETRLAQLATIVESSDDAIISTTLDGIVTSWNNGAQRIYGYSPHEVIGRPIAVLIPPDHVDEEPKILDRIKRSERVEHYETVRVTKAGKLIAVSLSISPIEDASGKVIGASKIARDITGRKRLEEQLRRKNEELEQQNRRVQEANRLKSEFLANMSHELRTPLNSIIGFAELMHDGKVGVVTPEQHEFLGDILTSSGHLLQLINDVLDLSKVESGKMEFHPKVLDLTRTISEVRDILRTLSGSKRISIAMEISPDLGQVELDPAKLKQVLYNYLSNALKFTPEGGHVTVRALAEGPDRFRLEVEDTGIGIRSEDIGRLFVEFQQLDASSAKKYPGTGLGLSLTKRIIEAQGGEVGVRSTLGQGSTFFAVLPRIRPAPAVPEVQPFKDSRFGQPLVLIIEDDARDRQWLGRTLTKAGYTVETAATGAEGLLKSAEQTFDAITLDLILPDMSGRDVLKAIRTAGPNRHTPVIVVTLLADRGVAAGFEIHDILVKPTQRDELLASLERADIRPDAPGRILVVDDDAQSLSLAEKTLRLMGYRPVCVSDGETALEVARQDPPGAVLLDLMMPGMDGFEFLQRFRNTPHGKHIPVIVWTVKDLGAEDRNRLLSDAQAVVMKLDGTAGLMEVLKTHTRQGGRSSGRRHEG
jgi:PAS domain S-box-containing protein